MKHFILFVLYIILFSSCTTKSHEEGINYSDFPDTKELTSVTLPSDTIFFRYPFRVKINNDKVIVMDLHGAKSFFHIFNYPDFSYLSSFGEPGESPEKMLSAETFCWNGDNIWTLDANKSELTRFKQDPGNDSIHRIEAVKLDESVLRALDFVVYNDSTFIIPDYSGENRFLVINLQGKVIDKIGNIPSTNHDAIKNSRPALAQAWRSFLDYNPRNGILAAVTQLGEVIEIYNIKDGSRKVLIGTNGEPKFQVSQGYGFPTGIMGFSDVKVTDNAIYAVFHGRSFKEIAKNQQNGIKIDGGKFIYVFNLKGEPLHKYELDHYIYGIDVDEKNGIIIATEVNEDNPILRYTINCEK